MNIVNLTDVKQASESVVNPAAVSLTRRPVRTITISSVRRMRTEHMYHGQQYASTAIFED